MNAQYWQAKYEALATRIEHDPKLIDGAEAMVKAAMGLSASSIYPLSETWTAFLSACQVQQAQKRIVTLEARVRELEASMKGRVLVKPNVVPALGGYDAGIPDWLPCEDGNGATEAEAIANLQALIDATPSPGRRR